MKTDCFACKNNKCTILIENVCKVRECSFFKTKEEYDAARKKAEERLEAKFRTKRWV